MCCRVNLVSLLWNNSALSHFEKPNSKQDLPNQTELARFIFKKWKNNYFTVTAHCMWTCKHWDGKGRRHSSPVPYETPPGTLISHCNFYISKPIYSKGEVNTLTQTVLKIIHFKTRLKLGEIPVLLKSVVILLLHSVFQVSDYSQLLQHNMLLSRFRKFWTTM